MRKLGKKVLGYHQPASRSVIQTVIRSLEKSAVLAGSNGWKVAKGISMRSMLQSFFKAPSVEIYWKHRSVTDTQVVNGWSLTPQKSKDKSFRTFQSAAVLRPSAYQHTKAIRQLQAAFFSFLIGLD